MVAPKAQTATPSVDGQVGDGRDVIRLMMQRLHLTTKLF
jgi:hypothetical protein